MTPGEKRMATPTRLKPLRDDPFMEKTHLPPRAERSDKNATASMKDAEESHGEGAIELQAVDVGGTVSNHSDETILLEKQHKELGRVGIGTQRFTSTSDVSVATRNTHVTTYSLPGAFSITGAGGSEELEDEISESSDGPLEEDGPLEDDDHSGLAEAWPVTDVESSLPQAVPQHESLEDATEDTDRKLPTANKRLCLCVVAVVVSLLVAAVEVSLVGILALTTDPGKLRYKHTKSLIIQTFGEDYFDNTHKEKALLWVAFEDPLQALGVEEDSGALSDHRVIQRFVLAAFYFQTSQQGPWTYCSQPVGEQPDSCIFLIKKKMGALEDRSLRWLSAANECIWMGVKCQRGTHDITELRIYGNGLAGTIPTEISTFSCLKFLRLKGNELSGSLPAWVSELTALEKIDLSINKFVGTIPPAYLSLPRLACLILRSNSLTGTIPTTITSFRYGLSLESDKGGNKLDLQNNMLGGPIPDSIYNLTKLEDLSLGGNGLSGTLSTELGQLTALTLLDVGGSGEIRGHLPSELGLLTAVVALAIWKTSIAGTIPNEIYDMSSLCWWDLNGNSISGTISPRLGQLRQLQRINLADNQFQGTIPNSLSLLTVLSELYIDGNPNLGGTIPRAFCDKRMKGSKLAPVSVAADCSPRETTGVPQVVCPQGCCTRCCDAQTKICLDQ